MKEQESLREVEMLLHRTDVILKVSDRFCFVFEVKVEDVMFSDKISCSAGGGKCFGSRS